jgi:hypothetical protein
MIIIMTPPNPSPTRGWPGFIHAVGGSNLTIRGADTTDYDAWPYMQGTCIPVNGTASFDIKRHPGHRTDLTNSDAHFAFNVKI